MRAKERQMKRERNGKERGIEEGRGRWREKREKGGGRRKVKRRERSREGGRKYEKRQIEVKSNEEIESTREIVSWRAQGRIRNRIGLGVKEKEKWRAEKAKNCRCLAINSWIHDLILRIGELISIHGHFKWENAQIYILAVSLNVT